MNYRAIVMASGMFCASACVAQEDAPILVRATAEIAKTYRIEIYDLFRCVVGLTPELREPAPGWAMTYTDEVAYIEAGGSTDIRFRPVSTSETQVLIRTIGNPYRAFFPGRFLATAEACALNPVPPVPLVSEEKTVRMTHHTVTIRARM
jgi:hypothetical protein